MERVEMGATQVHAPWMILGRSARLKARSGNPRLCRNLGGKSGVWRDVNLRRGSQPHTLAQGSQ